MGRILESDVKSYAVKVIADVMQIIMNQIVNRYEKAGYISMKGLHRKYNLLFLYLDSTRFIEFSVVKC